MSVDERQVRDALKAGVKALAMTDQDVERMRVDLHQRMRQRRRPRLWWAAAAAIVAVAAVVGGVGWARWTQTPALPVSTRVVPVAQVAGMWKGTDAAFPYLMVLRADGSQDTMTLGDPSLSWTDTHAFWQSLPGDTLVLNDVLDPRADCRYGFTGQWQADGVIRLVKVGQAGTGCGPDTQPQSFAMIRISPASPPGRSYTAAATDDQITTVTDVPSIWGAWLLRGTGVVLAVNPTQPPDVTYTLGANGDVGKGAEDHGRVAVPAPGRVILKSTDPTSCPDTILQNVSGGFYSMTAHVEADPCHRFSGQTELTWTRLQ